MGCPKQLALSDLKEILGPSLADPGLPKSALDLKRVDVVLTHAGLTFSGYAFDAALAATCWIPSAQRARAHGCNASSA